jgi:hypothetical protein
MKAKKIKDRFGPLFCLITGQNLPIVHGVVIMVPIPSILEFREQHGTIHILLIDHSAFEMKVAFSDDGYLDGLAQYRCQVQGFVLVHIPAGVGSTEGKGFLHAIKGDADGKFPTFFNQSMGVSGFTYRHNKDRFSPIVSDAAPSDGHGIGLFFPELRKIPPLVNLSRTSLQYVS